MNNNDTNALFLAVSSFLQELSPRENIQLFLLNSLSANSLRAVLGMGNENGLACYGFDKSSFGCCVEKVKRQVRVRGKGMGEGFMFRV